MLIHIHRQDYQCVYLLPNNYIWYLHCILLTTMLLYLTLYGWCCTSFILPRILHSSFPFRAHESTRDLINTQQKLLTRIFFCAVNGSNPYMHKTLPLLPESSLQSYHKPSRMAHVQTRVQHLASVRNN